MTLMNAEDVSKKSYSVDVLMKEPISTTQKTKAIMIGVVRVTKDPK